MGVHIVIKNSFISHDNKLHWLMGTPAWNQGSAAIFDHQSCRKENPKFSM